MLRQVLCRDLGHDTAMGTRGTRPRHGHLACDMAGGPGHDTARHGARGTTTRHLRASLGALVCSGWPRLCTWCTQPIFGLSTISESLFGTLFMNTVHHKNF